MPRRRRPRPGASGSTGLGSGLGVGHGVGVAGLPPVVAGSRRTSFAVVLGVWGLLIATLPLYFTFLLFNLSDVLTILSNLRALPTRTPFSDDEADSEVDADARDPDPADPAGSGERQEF